MFFHRLEYEGTEAMSLRGSYDDSLRVFNMIILLETTMSHFSASMLHWWIQTRWRSIRLHTYKTGFGFIYIIVFWSLGVRTAITVWMSRLDSLVDNLNIPTLKQNNLCIILDHIQVWLSHTDILVCQVDTLSVYLWLYIYTPSISGYL